VAEVVAIVQLVEQAEMVVAELELVDHHQQE
jgi:hypothetical protein